MLEELAMDDWYSDDIEDFGDTYVLALTDFNAIGRNADNCADAAWSLEMMAGKISRTSHCVVETRRDEYHKRWLARCVHSE